MQKQPKLITIMKATVLFSSALLALLSIAAMDSSAHGRHSIRGHERHQQIRINQGVRRGELTPKEASHLREEQKDVRQDVKLAKSDGKVTAGERKMIRAEQRKESRRIYRQK